MKTRATLHLSSMVPAALSVLAREMMSTTNRSQDRIRAAAEVLDRAGMPRQVGIDTDAAMVVLLDKLRRSRDRIVEALPDAPPDMMIDIEGDHG